MSISSALLAAIEVMWKQYEDAEAKSEEQTSPKPTDAPAPVTKNQSKRWVPQELTVPEDEDFELKLLVANFLVEMAQKVSAPTPRYDNTNRDQQKTDKCRRILY